MFGNMMRYVAGQQADGEVDRPEFDAGSSVDGWPEIADATVRKRVESFVLKTIPEAHKVVTAGGTRVVYLDARGRAVDSVIEEVPDADLARMAKRYGMRFGGGNGPTASGSKDPKPAMTPETSADNHGYKKPATEEVEQLDEKTYRVKRAPQLPKAKYVLGSQVLPDEAAAIRAAMTASRQSDGKAIKIWRKPDPMTGERGAEGLSISVKRITRSPQIF